MASRTRTSSRQREPLLDKTQTAVLTKSRRRCCLCFWLDGIDEVATGQIAHLDQDRTNSSEDNLAFLCLKHHDQYDSVPSQSKGLREKEVRHWREELHKEMSFRFREHTALGQRRKEDYERAEKSAGDLLGAMRKDMHQKPLARLLCMTHPSVRHSGPWELLTYFYKDFPLLREKTLILANLGLLKRDDDPEADDFFWITEDLADYLLRT